MKLIIKTSEIQAYVNSMRAEGKTIGFVPTMGFLHEGHLSLVRQARADNDIVIVSIFVNPTQFGPQEDYTSYPRDLDQDSLLLSAIGVDAVFAPTADEMYPRGYSTHVEVTGSLTTGLCGASRPAHFRGVTTVVAKLFNLAKPHRAYFGQKDAQQLAVIQRMVEDLNFDIEIVPMPTIREEDGLAMSSRNRYLNAEERKAALVLYQSLNLAGDMIKAGERNVEKIAGEIERLIESEPLAKIDYIAIVDARSMEELLTSFGGLPEVVAEVAKTSGNSATDVNHKSTVLKDETLIALAVFIGKTRLIDNFSFHICRDTVREILGEGVEFFP